jgi:dihydrofolate reductase
MKVVLIVAMDLDRGIGKNNDLMWRLPADMKFFKETTSGEIVVMGRKNYESIPERFRPLPNRENVVLTRNADYKAIGANVFTDFKAILEAYQNDERTMFIIGGGEIYKLAMNAGILDEMYITHVNSTYGADTFFPNFDLKEWKVETIKVHQQDEKNEASFSIIKYRK